MAHFKRIRIVIVTCEMQVIIAEQVEWMKHNISSVDKQSSAITGKIRVNHRCKDYFRSSQNLTKCKLIEDWCEKLVIVLKQHNTSLHNYSVLQCISQNFWQMVSEVCLKFPNFTMNLAISLHSCQSNCELGNEVVNLTTNFVGKLRSSSRETCTPFGVNVLEFS